jgi:hypothetical protein
MLFFDGGFGLLLFGLWLFCIFDVITTDEAKIKHLPKIVWLMIVLLIPDIGSVAWLVAGHSWDARNTTTPPHVQRVQREFPEYDRPGRHLPANPDDDEAFLRRVRDRAAEQRKAAERQRHERDNPDQA